MDSRTHPRLAHGADDIGVVSVCDVSDRAGPVAGRSADGPGIQSGHPLFTDHPVPAGRRRGSSDFTSAGSGPGYDGPTTPGLLGSPLGPSPSYGRSDRSDRTPRLTTWGPSPFRPCRTPLHGTAVSDLRGGYWHESCIYGCKVPSPGSGWKGWEAPSGAEDDPVGHRNGPKTGSRAGGRLFLRPVRDFIA